jgi:hypothetical protein
MAEQLVPDDIWDAIAPLLPTDPVDRAGCAAGHLADAEMQGDPAALKIRPRPPRARSTPVLTGLMVGDPQDLDEAEGGSQHDAGR